MAGTPQMSEARTQILASLKRALGRERPSPEDEAMLTARVTGAHPGLIPDRTKGLDQASLVDLFQRKAEEVATSVARVPRWEDLPEAIADYLRAQNLPSEMVASPDPRLTGVPWQKRPMLKLKYGRPDGSEEAGLTVAQAAIAETGTVMVLSGETSPSTINFLPETSLVVLPARDVVGPMEDALARLRENGVPRTVNFITGPSRTGDIEQKIEMGAHGPRRLHILIVGDGA
jgi:L-lactate dehydrogenase complex protein LldG